ncbi:MAG: M24 family metallopeptidase, partial [Pseudomonadota bacterium]
MDGLDRAGVGGFGQEPDGSPIIPMTLEAGWPDFGASIDQADIRAYRLARVQEQLRQHDLAGIILMDPLNIRYATGTSNMQVWITHNAARYCWVPVEGRAVLWDFHNCDHLSNGIGEVGEVRLARGMYFFGAGSRMREYCTIFAHEIAELAQKAGGSRIAADHCHHLAVGAMEKLGLTVEDGQGPMELARLIKSSDEIACMRQAVAVCELGMARMREALRPGLTENGFWSILHQTNTALGGEWIETRLLASGQRTNPWFQECSNRVIQAGEMVSFDTDLVGPYG